MGWAAAPHKPLAGCITFFEPDQRTARESVAWEAGECVSYHEEFLSGSQELGAYVCHLIIAAPKLTLRTGSAGQYVPPAARTHGVPLTIENGSKAKKIAKAATGKQAGNPMNPVRMALWRNYLEKRGVRFFIGTPEAELKLHDNKADGLFSSNSSTKTIFLHDPPSTATFFEEAFHALQHMRGHPTVKFLEDGRKIDAWEYDAKQALLKHSEKLGLSYEEYIETEKQLQQVIDDEYGISGISFE